jgi:predicted secreted acid phosphatase
VQKIKRLLIVLFSVFCSLLSATVIAQPANLDLHKIELERYHDGDLYTADITNRIREAQYYLKFRITQNKRLKTPQKLAMILGIDETALSNYEDIKRFQFGGTPEERQAANSDGHDPAIAATLSLFNFATKNHVAVFFISNRKGYERQNTIKNLHNVGYRDWDGLLLEPENYHRTSQIPFKVASRKKVIEMGYDIVLDVGDQWSDLKGGYADMVIKLPNPFYYLN